MPLYSIITDVVQTRAYAVVANSAEEALEDVRSEFEIMEFDILEQVIDTASVEEIDNG